MGAKDVKKSDGGEKKPKDEGGAVKVVLKIDMHCDGCAKKVKRSVKGFPGVETVTADIGSSTLTIVGKVDPWKIRERVEAKTHKTVVLVSPTDPPKKKEADNKSEDKPKEKDKPKEEKPKKVVSTVVMNLRLHCDGCIQRIRRTIYKLKGVEDVIIDAKKDLVTVKGTMDPKPMVQFLQDKFKRTIEVVPVKKDDGGEKKEKEKEKEKDKDGGGEKKEKEKDKDKDKDKDKSKDKGGDGKKEKGSDGKNKDGGGEKKDGGKKKGEEATDNPPAAMAEANKMDYYGGGGGHVNYYEPHPYQYQQPQYNYQQPQYHYQQPYNMQMAAHAPQMFSDENPNACSIM